VHSRKLYAKKKSESWYGFGSDELDEYIVVNNQRVC